MARTLKEILDDKTIISKERAKRIEKNALAEVEKHAKEKDIITNKTQQA